MNYHNKKIPLQIHLGNSLGESFDAVSTRAPIFIDAVIDDSTTSKQTFDIFEESFPDYSFVKPSKPIELVFADTANAIINEDDPALFSIVNSARRNNFYPF